MGAGLKIALVIERIEMWRGGAETSSMEIANLLAQRGHDVHIITATNAQNLPGIRIHTVTTPTVLRGRRLASFARRADAVARREAFDVVHAISPMPTADIYQPRGGLLPEIVARNVATRTTATRRLLKRALMAMNVKQRAQLDLERRIFRDDGPMIACVSEYVARQCREHYDADPSRVRVVFNGVNPTPLTEATRAQVRRTVRDELSIDPDALVLLFMAHNYRLKGLNPLLDAIARLKTGGFDRFALLVAGRGNVVPFRRRAEMLGLESRVIFTGPTQRSAHFFAMSDVFVHPTFYDPCSRVVLEALYHGVPCITTSFNGAAEVIRDGSNGFVIDRPDDVGLLARRIHDLSSPELRAQFSQKSLALREQISMSRHVTELEALYAEVQARRITA